MPSESGFDVVDFADRLVEITDVELFRTIEDLENEKRRLGSDGRETTDVFAIELVQTAIETRFPGQLLAAYSD